jgi:hypothetical protein
MATERFPNHPIRRGVRVRPARTVSYLVGMLLAMTALLIGFFWWKSKPQEALCPIETLLLDEEQVPGASAGDILSPLPDSVASSAGRTFYYPLGIANHSVYRYRTSQRAQRHMESQRELVLRHSSWREFDSLSEDIASWMARADESSGKCGAYLTLELCFVFARYNEHVVVYNAHTGPDGTSTREDIARNMRIIDQLMTECLPRN